MYSLSFVNYNDNQQLNQICIIGIVNDTIYYTAAEWHQWVFNILTALSTFWFKLLGQVSTGGVAIVVEFSLHVRDVTVLISDKVYTINY